MPFTYAQIGFSALISWLFFNHAPDIWAWLGIWMIAASGGETAWLNIRRKS
jgi:drug/metabolite transporter (DMT)-like permease